MNRSARELRRWSSGFTLIETLVALALLLVLVGSVFAFGMNLAASRDRLNRHMRQSQAVRVFLDRLEQDLHTSLAVDAGQGAGIVGDASSLRLLSRSVGTMSQAEGVGIALRDLQRSAYRWNDGGRRLEATRGAAAASPAWSAITEDLGYVQWRYHDGQSWTDRFDSATRQRLPVAVEVAIWFVPPPRDPNDAMVEEGPVADETTDPTMGLLDPASPFIPDTAPDELLDESRRDWPPPDRVRLIIIPDAPDFEYGRSYEDDPDASVSPPAPSEEGGAP